MRTCEEILCEPHTSGQERLQYSAAYDQVRPCSRVAELSLVLVEGSCSGGPRTLIAEIRVFPCDNLGRRTLQLSATQAASAALLEPPSLILMGAKLGTAQLQLTLRGGIEAEAELWELMEFALDTAALELTAAGYILRRNGRQAAS